MRITLPILIGLLVMTTATAFAANTGGEKLLIDRATRPGEWQNDFPIQNTVGTRVDTVWFGQYDPGSYADGHYQALWFLNKPEGSWTFDRGTGPASPPEGHILNGEGWRVVDLTANNADYFRVIDSSLDLGVGVPAPVISGNWSLWVGADKPQSDAMCWECGAGYGNDWCQRVTSPDLAYNGTGDIILAFDYWVFTEPCYDGVQIYLKRDDSTELMLNPYPAGECTNNTAYEGGTFTDSIAHYSTPLPYSRTITAAEIGGAGTLNIIFEFSADGGWSDEDCDYATIWGPFGADDVSISGPGINAEFFDFETGTLEGWATSVCQPIGTFVDIVDVGCYTILDPCACRLANNILEMHADLCDAGVHPVGQNIMAISPVCDIVAAYADQGFPFSLQTIFMEFDIYAVMPLENGVLHRPGWLYYPHVCEVTGAVGWSGRVGQSAYNYIGTDPVCYTARYGGTTIASGVPVPADAQKVQAVIELLGDCASFTIDPCSGVTNFTPLYDNIAVGVTEGVNAPIVSFPNGQLFQDVGSYPNTLFDPRAEGPANVTRDLYMDTAPGSSPDVCGDTLSVTGPIPGSDPNTRWEAKLWFRVSKRGPFQTETEDGADSRYKIWRDRVSDNNGPIDRPDNPRFTWAWMDSAQLGFIVKRNEFVSTFRENDDDFVGEGLEENEIIWDDVLRPGTQIEYFVTANFAHLPTTYYYLPDTTGGFFREFEILPGIRTANVPNCGGTGFDYCVYQPATLYIDAYNRGGEFFVENALRTVLNGEDACIDEDGCEIPKDRNWDRYDYWDPSSNWNAPFVRGSVAGSNNGMTLDQILGYRAILLHTGTLGEGCMQDEDYDLFEQWLISPSCNANLNRQVFIANGDKMGEAMERPGGQDIAFEGLAFENGVIGATTTCESFNGFSDNPNCAPENTSFCVRYYTAGGAVFPNLTDVDAFGNYCPNLYGFNVYGAVGGTGSTGNRIYLAEDGLKDAAFAQVVNEDLAVGNYRVVMDGVSWHHMTARVGPGGTGSDEWCPRTTPSIVDASLSEIRAAMRWGFGVADDAGIPKLSSAENLANCQGTWTFPSDAGDGPAFAINRLFQNEPNPFNPRTKIRFSLAESGPVKIVVYDVNGRAVRTLVDGAMDAGPHSVVWDGTNDSGKKVGSGVYWTKMMTKKFESNKQMVILK